MLKDEKMGCAAGAGGATGHGPALLAVVAAALSTLGCRPGLPAATPGPGAVARVRQAPPGVRGQRPSPQTLRARAREYAALEAPAAAWEALRRAGVLKDGGPKDGGSKDGGSKDGGPKDGGPKDGGPKDGGPKDGVLKDGGPKDGGSKDGGSKGGGPNDGGPKDDGSKDGGPKDGGPKDGGPKDGGPKDGGPNDGAAEALVHRLRLQLADRALVTGRQAAARRAYGRLHEAGALTGDERAWRQAALSPSAAPLSALGRAIRELASRAPGTAAGLARPYLERGGEASTVLLVALRAALRQPRRDLIRALDARLARQPAAAAWRAACAAVGRPATSACCHRAAASAPPGSSPVREPDSAEGPASRCAGPPAPPPDVAARRGVAPPPRSDPAATRRVLQRAWRATARGRLERALALLAEPARTDPLARRWRARLAVLAGRRREAAQRLRSLLGSSPGGVRHLPAVLADLTTLGLHRAAVTLARRALHRGARDPALLRPVAAALIAAQRPEAARLAVERWASQSGDPARAFGFAMRRWAAQASGRQTLRWARRLLRWRGSQHPPTLRAVVRSLRRAGQGAEARRVKDWALASRTHPRDRRALEKRLAPRAPAAERGQGSAPSARAVRARCRGWRGGPARSPAALQAACAYLAAARAQRAGDRARAARLLARGLAHDPRGLGRLAWLRLAAASQGRRLSPWIPWAILRCSSPRSGPP